LGSRPPGYIRPFASVVLTVLPLAAALSARRRRWCATALAGMCAFWALLLLATTVSPTTRSFLPWLSFAAGLGVLVGAIALLRRLPQAPLLSLIAIIVSFLLLQYVVTL